MFSARHPVSGTTSTSAAMAQSSAPLPHLQLSASPSSSPSPSPKLALSSSPPMLRARTPPGGPVPPQPHAVVSQPPGHHQPNPQAPPAPPKSSAPTAPAPPPPCSISLAINGEDAMRMMQASKAFNQSLSNIRANRRKLNQPRALFGSSLSPPSAGNASTAQSDEDGRRPRSRLGEGSDSRDNASGTDSPNMDTDTNQHNNDDNKSSDLRNDIVINGDEIDMVAICPPSAEEEDGAIRMMEDDEVLEDVVVDLDLASPSASLSSIKKEDNAQSPAKMNTLSDKNEQQTKYETNLPELVEAAKACQNPLVRSVLSGLQTKFSCLPQAAPDKPNPDRRSLQEIESALILFLDMDKSTKLLTSFGVLGKNKHQDSGDGPDSANKPSRDGSTQETHRSLHDTLSPSSSKGSDDPDADPSLTPEGMETLFRSFLTVISMCLNNAVKETKDDSPHNSSQKMESNGSSDARRKGNGMDCDQGMMTTDEDPPIKQEEKKEDGQDDPIPGKSSLSCALSGKVEKEIADIASHATDQLLRHLDGASPSFNSPNKGPAVQISFEAFGEWYNVGGFELVPWLELLDLAKWDYAGRASNASSSSAANAGGSHHQPHYHHPGAAPMPQHQDYHRHHQQQNQGPPPILSVITEESPRMDCPTPPLSTSISPPLGFGPVSSSPRHPQHGKNNGNNMMGSGGGSNRCVVSFDFTGAMPTDRPLHINITEENLSTFKTVVTRTGLSNRTPQDMCDVILRHATMTPASSVPKSPSEAAAAAAAAASGQPHSHNRSSSSLDDKPSGPTLTLNRDGFGRCMRELVVNASSLQEQELVSFSNFLCGLFGCFDRRNEDLVNAKELAAGFSFLCGGNKSSKLAVAFRLVDENQNGFLTARGLRRFLRAYLTVIVGISMSSSRCMFGNAPPTSKSGGRHQELTRSDMFLAVDNGANWTQSHIFGSNFRGSQAARGERRITFEDFASWYTEGGYTVAPWLELLDLSKFISLLDAPAGNGPGVESKTGDSIAEEARGGAISRKKSNTDSLSHGRSMMEEPGARSGPASTRAQQQGGNKEVLFSFPLANDHSLLILKEDVFYVRSVVDQLGLPMIYPGDLWSSLNKNASSAWTGFADQETFVRAMEASIYNLSGRKIDDGARFTLRNFFSSYDFEQVHRVQLSQLMGGITLLCNGRKSAKLAFSFGLFDGRSGSGNNASSSSGPDSHRHGENGPALNGDELFLFLRSFLIVLFSCCAQSLELTADVVSLWINDTSKMVCENVMRYQWNSGKRSVNFDDFGIWYNQGGFEVAPWLELLDLNKWVLDQSTPSPQDNLPNASCSTTMNSDSDIQPMMDGPLASEFPYDDFDGLDNMIMQSDDKENDNNPPSISLCGPSNGDDSSSLTFQLLTNEEHGGYLVAISQARVALLRQLVTESGLHRMEPSQVSSRILEYSDKDSGSLSKDKYDCAIRSTLSGVGASMAPETQQRLSEILTSIFYAFDRDRCHKVDAVELASGFTVLCGGRKSDKLEFSFELIDDDRDGKLSRQGLCKYLRSFLTVLLSLSSAKAAMNEERIHSAIQSGALWVTSQVFGDEDINSARLISFDEFAAWYTKGGYGVIPWLELLDLKKWVIVP